LVPGFLDAVNQRLVGPLEVARELQIVGRIGEDEIDRFGGELGELGQAIPHQHLIKKGPDVRPPGHSHVPAHALSPLTCGAHGESPIGRRESNS
jgi:hypothetical protein